MSPFIQSMFANASPEATGILKLWWILLSMGSLGLLAFFVLTIISVCSTPSPSKNSVEQRPLWLYGGAAVTLIVIFVVLIATFVFKPTVKSIPENALKIEIVGKQWWWEVNYLDQNGNLLFSTANEIVIPTKQPVHLLLKTTDVIHSFWVPPLAGKVDMIPGQTNHLLVEADHEGNFRGQCAEFCGLQHAKMAFLVIAVSADEFTQWRNQMQIPHQRPTSEEEQHGLEVFLKVGCLGCHNIDGIAANPAAIGPDLTYLAKRTTIGAALLPNRRGHLASWVANPDNAKVGTLMPQTMMTGDEFRALISFLEYLE